MRILFITGSITNKSSGPYETLLATATLLSNHGNSVFIVGTHDILDKKKIYFEHNNLKIYALKRIGPYNYHYSPKLKSILDEINPDIIHMNAVWQYNCWEAANWANKRDIPYVVTVHGNLNEVALSKSNLKKHILFKLIVKKFLQNAKFLHALTSVEEVSIRKKGITNKIIILPNGVFTKTVDTFVKNSLHTNTLLYLGRIHPIKNFENLIIAWSQLRHYLGKWRLLVVGDFSDIKYENKIKTICNDLEFGASLLFYGSVEENEAKENIYINSDGFILPSLSEGLPMAALEAMSFGLPCILSNNCNLSEIYVDSYDLSCDIDVESIKAAIERLVNLTPEKRQIIGNNNKQIVAKKFDWEKIVTHLNLEYEKLI